MSFLTPLYERPNNILEKQRYYQNNHAALYMRGPRQKLYFGAFCALFAGGMIGTVYAIGNLVADNKAE
ncbi:hypothetical protein Agabi119p4_4195 [Agaricus bisporus var. burnettii]|uniref:Uncharacterized protein n=1 Tax=Agaricus bisporus var. burnettii TaxID=192524 RepID=A0A8H7KH51_AGABI|nr:hypothetical protein Agabi119p4_4195 [Agaricus bisporus var. burnettii]